APPPELDARVDDAGLPPEDAGSASGWRSEAPLPVAWQEIAAAVRGDEIWVVGGFEGFSQVDAVRVYDLATGAWRDGPSLPSERHHLMVAVVGDDLYALGGETGLSFTPVDTAWVLREGATAWEDIAPLPEARGAGVAAVVDGRIVLAGGVGDGNALVGPVDFYDPATGTWSTTRGAAIPTRREHTAGFAHGGRVWIVGGRNLSLSTNMDVVEVYDVASDTWTTGPSLALARGGFGIGLIGDRAYAVGGEQPDRALDEVEVLDLAAMTWSAAPSVPTPRHGHAVVGAAGRVWVVGGADRPIFAPVTAVESYAP
ncbi:MAG: protein kinase, partial [Deltaproteobacteria bacterium]|nr:protein kinase [Deltaproteobacteria bacterium]